MAGTAAPSSFRTATNYQGEFAAGAAAWRRAAYAARGRLDLRGRVFAAASATAAGHLDHCPTGVSPTASVWENGPGRDPRGSRFGTDRSDEFQVAQAAPRITLQRALYGSARATSSSSRRTTSSAPSSTTREVYAGRDQDPGWPRRDFLEAWKGQLPSSRRQFKFFEEGGPVSRPAACWWSKDRQRKPRRRIPVRRRAMWRSRRAYHRSAAVPGTSRAALGQLRQTRADFEPRGFELKQLRFGGGVEGTRRRPMGSARQSGGGTPISSPTSARFGHHREGLGAGRIADGPASNIGPAPARRLQVAVSKAQVPACHHAIVWLTGHPRADRRQQSSGREATLLIRTTGPPQLHLGPGRPSGASKGPGSPPFRDRACRAHL